MWLPSFDFLGLTSSLCSVSDARQTSVARDSGINSEEKEPPSKVGIGALLGTIGGLRNTPWYVSAVLEGSSAHVAGLQPGDLVIQVRNSFRFPIAKCCVLKSAARSMIQVDRVSTSVLNNVELEQLIMGPEV